MPEQLHNCSFLLVCNLPGEAQAMTDHLDILDRLLRDSDPLQTTYQLESPLIFRKSSKRRFVSSITGDTLDRLLPELPTPGEDVWLVSNGDGGKDKHGRINPDAFDFGSFIPYAVSKLGGYQCQIKVSTWSINHHHVDAMLAMLDDGRADTLWLLVDPSLRTRKSADCARLIEGMRRYPGRGRYLAFANHAKILCVCNADKTRHLTVFGSANLTGTPRAENYVLSADPALHDYFVTHFFKAMFDGR